MGIHAYLLWADFGWIGGIPSLKPKPQMVTLTLVSRPMLKTEPAPKISKPASISKPEPAPEPKPRPAPESKPETTPVPKPRPAPKSDPEPGHRRVSEVQAPPPPVEKQNPSQFISETLPVPDSRPEPIIGEEKPDDPAPDSGLETLPRKVQQAAEPAQPGPVGPVESLPAPALIREARPRYRDNPHPPYPILARKRGYQGTVVLDVFIDKNGHVADMKIFSSSGYSTLDKAARATVENWLFEPGLKGEEKIEMWVKVPIRFQLK